jgi:hypothetical protein
LNREIGAVLCASFVLSLTPLSRAQDEAPRTTQPPTPPPQPDLIPPAAPPPTATPEEVASLRAELARQSAALDDMRASIDKLQHAWPSYIRVGGYVQVDWVVHNQSSQDEINGSTGQPLNLDRFTLRRGHLRVEAEHGIVSGALEIDANTTNGPQVRPLSAEASIRWPEKPDDRLPQVRATAGLTQIPFGFEAQELDNVRPFLERSTVVEAMFPGAFDLGAKLRSTYRFLNLSVAVMNGNPIGASVFPDLDPSKSKDLLGRLGVDIEVVKGVRLLAGVSADTGTGFHPGTPATKFQLVWQDMNGNGMVDQGEINVVGGQAATPSQEFHRWAVGGDVRLIVSLPRVGELAFRAEIIDAVNLDRELEVADPIAAGHDLRELGWYVGATQELTKWGQIGVRYDAYNPDADASQQRAITLVPVNRSYTTLALMAMLRYERQRLVLEYDINTNPLGIGSNGAPTTLADNALTLRAQVQF